MTKGIAALVAAGAFLLAGCDEPYELQPVITSETTGGGQGEPAICDSIRSLKSANESFAADGHSDNYGAEYDQQLRSAGCRP